MFHPVGGRCLLQSYGVPNLGGKASTAGPAFESIYSTRTLLTMPAAVSTAPAMI